MYGVGDNDKTVFIIPGEREVFTVAIKNLTEVIQNGETPYKVTTVRANPPAMLLGVTVTAQNTICYTCDGQLAVFSSFRNCVPVEGIRNVKAIAAMDKGSKLVIISLINGDKLKLEVIEDLCDERITKSLGCYDLSWENKGFLTNRYDQRLCVKTIRVTGSNKKFFQRLLNSKDFLEDVEIIVFTVNSGLFWLKILEDSYEVVAIKTYASKIVEVDFSHSSCCFAVLLENAILNVISISNEPERCLLEEEYFSLGHEVEAFIFLEDLGTILFSDGYKLVQLRFFYSELSKTVDKETKEIALHGVVGIVHVKFADVAICITENCLFHAIFIQHEYYNCKDAETGKYFEITNEVLTQAKQMTCLLTNEVEIHNKLIETINEEQAQTNVMNILCNTTLYKKFVSAKLTQHNRIPSTICETVFLEKTTMDNCLFIHIELFLKTDFSKVLQNSNWMISVEVDSFRKLFRLDKTLDKEHECVQMILPVRANYLNQKGLPSLVLSLLKVVSHTNDCLILEIPVNLQTSNDVGHSIESRKPKHNYVVSNPHKDTIPMAKALICQNQNEKPGEKKNIEYCFKISQTVDYISQLLHKGIGIHEQILQTVADEENSSLWLGTEIMAEMCLQKEHGKCTIRSYYPGFLLIIKRRILQSEVVDHKCSRNELMALNLRLTRIELDLVSIIQLYQKQGSPGTDTPKVHMNSLLNIFVKKCVFFTNELTTPKEGFFTKGCFSKNRSEKSHRLKVRNILINIFIQRVLSRVKLHFSFVSIFLFSFA
ncbi:uncharacterized protein LOC129746908 isoform X2 [Uranotaenia lowii]|nr:uncharacterized protein LOC129746908 isoform X2 [Uranotaenia lowii]